MALRLEEYREVIRQRKLLGNDLNFDGGGKMTANDRSKTAEDLIKICAEAGALATTTIASEGEVVVFYKDGYGQSDSFDELHIRPQKKACILIAVFNS
jgi:hypothetical protein